MKNHIEQTKAAKEAYEHPIIEILLTPEPKTKKEIGEELHITSDRGIRDIISICSMYYPILALSGKKGYRRAKNIDSLKDAELIAEIGEVEHQIKELNSRIKCLKKRMKPLFAWLSIARKKLPKEEV